MAVAVLGCGLAFAGCAATGRTGSVPGRAAADSRAVPVDARPLLAARYLAIARDGNRRLDRDFDALDGRDRGHLAAADADLRDIAATERLFDRRLLSITFPPRTEQTAQLLADANQARARLTQTAASSASLSQLHSYQQRLDQANEPVEQAVRIIRSRLGLPPPDTS